jgi:hypothetical protein
MFGGDTDFANISDSNSPFSIYSYEFPADSLELPASRAEELRFYRLAVDRDPIVGRAIDMHTELPLSKMENSKPKCSSPEFADFVFDEFQRLCQKTNLFQVLIDASRDYWTIGEAFIFVEKSKIVGPCKEAKKGLENDQEQDGIEPGQESQFNVPIGGTSGGILEEVHKASWVKKEASWLAKQAKTIGELAKRGIELNLDSPSDKNISVAASALKKANKNLNVRVRHIAKTAGVSAKVLANLVIEADKGDISAAAKLAKIISRDSEDVYPIQVTAAPGDPVPDAGGGAPGGPGGAPAPAGGPEAPMPEGGPVGDAGAIPGGAPLDPNAPIGEEGIGDMGGDMPMGGGGGGGGGMMTPADSVGNVKDAIAMGSSVSAQRELMELKHELRLLQKKKELLEELKEMREKKKEELELFSHVVNGEYEGPDRIQILPPEQIELANEGTLTDGPTIYYKPPAGQKEAYLNNPDIPSDVKGMIETEGKMPLNQDPMKGSYVIHFARKKANYELHGRSILQRCIRTIMYREKLRQVQSVLASRNMTPKTLVVAPDIPASEVLTLRAHVDEAKNDPDYSVVVNFEMRWDEIGSEGRLLALEPEWSHTNSDLAVGLGLSPELLIGEGMFSGSRIQLQLMETSYLQFRDLLTSILEEKIFKPFAMEKGFYEKDKYGRARWIFPKVTFSRMALRDQGDLLDILNNLFVRGNLPIEVIYEFLNLDAEDCKKKLEDNLFTVMDSKMNEALSTINNSVGEWMMTSTDVGERIAKGLTLEKLDNEAEQSMEGTGEGLD